MMKVKYYRCPICNKKYKTLSGWGSHMESTHPESIPEGYSISRYFYFTVTGKTHGICRTCKKDTTWNEDSQKYNQYCDNPDCKKAYAKIAKQRMIGKYGKIHLLNDPEMQKKMLSNRRISGKYTFKDGTKFEYVGSYEKEFLKMLDTLMEWPSNDLMAPSPHTYYYDYKNPKDDKKNEGVKFYIPDFYIPSLNLEIEVKQQTSTNQAYNDINKVKESLKDDVMRTNKNVNYIKINDNNFTTFFEFLMKAKDYVPTKEEIRKDQMELVVESVTNGFKENLELEYELIFGNTTDMTISLENTQYTKENKYPVFIVLMHSGTILANTIQFFTKDEFSHACISFNPKLDPLYSFGNKKAIGLDPGFVIQNQYDPFYKRKKAYFSVYAMYVNKETYHKMTNRLQWFVDHKDELKYDLRNLISVAFGKPSENSEKYFCSRFVMDVLKAGKEYDKVASLYRPQELSEFEDITLVNRGRDFSKYDYTITMKNLKKIQRNEFDEIAFEASMNYFAMEGVQKTLNEERKEYPVKEKEAPSIVKRFGIVSDNGVYNCCVKIDGYPNTNFRYRSELLVLKGDKLYISFNHDGTYELPGGSLDENETPDKAAIREAKEEARLLTKNPVFHGVYTTIHHDVKEWVKENVPKEYWWNGYYSAVYTAEYTGKYNGNISEEDKDTIINTGRFYPIDKVYDKLYPIHQKAIDAYRESNVCQISKENYTEINNISDSYFRDATEEEIANLDTYFDSISYPTGVNFYDDIAQEGFFMNFINKIKEKFTINKSWKQSIGLDTIEPEAKELLGKAFIGVRFKDGNIEIRGINYTTLRNRIIKYYGDKSIYNIFLPKYNALSYKSFEKKQISRSQIKISYLYAPEFFALELVTLFTDLGKRFRDKVYKSLAVAIYNGSWLSEADKKLEKTPLLDTSPVNNLQLELKPYQIDFISKYPKLKAQLNLNGYVLAFEQGLGKTITAVSLAECLHADHVYIVCPNSLKENWALEIQKYYKKYSEDDDLWKSEVYICSKNSILFDENITKFIITNNESIDKMYPYVMNGKNLLIIDESQNFRNINSKRSQQLMVLRDKLKCTDILAMSGTPIKATPSELTPVLAMIDPTFTEEAAKCFDKAFKLNYTIGTSLVQARFGKVIYRKQKDVLEDKLPPKHIENLMVSISNGTKYTLDNVTSVVMKRFAEIYENEYDEAFALRDPFFEITKKYSLPNEDFRRFKSIIRVTTSHNEWPHEIDKIFAETYMKNIMSRMKSSDEKKRYDFMIKKFVRFKMHCLGIAFGEILPKYRKDMFIAMYDENKNMIHKMIRENTKKVLIFSQFKPVVNYIYNDLNLNEIGTVMITGDVKNRMEILKEFKNNDEVRVLIATSQTIGTGVTLTEASKMLFFGPPWRDADFEQCSDRIHRIGQTDEVFIYTLTLDTGDSQNLSTRMDSILSWSKRMTDASISVTDDDKNIDQNDFENILKAEESTISLESYVDNESYVESESIITENYNSYSNYYFVSGISMNDELLTPRIPDNYLTQIGAEDSTTPRVCLSDNIGGCLTGLSMNLENRDLYVHVPEENINVKTPSLKEVPDRNCTGEVWCEKPITIRCIGKIHVDNALKPMKYKYKKDGKLQTAETYTWSWRWIERYDDNGRNIISNEAYEALSDKELFDEFMMKETSDKLNIYKEIPSKFLDRLIHYETGFRMIKAITNYNIPKDCIIESQSVKTGKSGKFKDLLFSKLGNAVFANQTQNKGSVRWEYVNDNGYEYWNLISNKNIKKGTVLNFNPKTNFPSFADPNRF